MHRNNAVSVSPYHPEDEGYPQQQQQQLRIHEHRGEAEQEVHAMSDESSTFSEDASDDVGWIHWFLMQKGSELFCEVEEEYIQDDFNLYGLAAQVDYYENALDMILDCYNAAEFTPAEDEAIESSALFLYGLIHARFIITQRGLMAMEEKYKSADFGRCPRVYCQGQPVLPVGLSDVPRQHTVKMFCPRCEDVYYPKSNVHTAIDGAFFGTTFPHLFFQTYPELVPPKPSEKYVPRIFGFRLHKSARLHPESDDEVDGDSPSQHNGSSRSRKQLESGTAEAVVEEEDGPINGAMQDVGPSVASSNASGGPQQQQHSHHQHHQHHQQLLGGHYTASSSGTKRPAAAASHTTASRSSASSRRQ